MVNQTLSRITFHHVNEDHILNIINKLNKSIDGNPQANYAIFSEHMQESTKMNEWMNNYILNSINTKNQLYKRFFQCNIENETIYSNLKNEYKVYGATLRKNIRDAKRAYFIRKFNTCKNDIKK